jgi:uncharacterized protein YjiS (DUF1127 family)
MAAAQPATWPVTYAIEPAIIFTMTVKALEGVIERVRHWPKQRQEDAAEILLEMERQDSSDYGLTDAQAEQVAAIQRDIRAGRGSFATDEQMAGLWKSCGLRGCAIRSRRAIRSPQSTAISTIAIPRLPVGSSHASDRPRSG